MKDSLIELIKQALQTLASQEVLPQANVDNANIQLTHTKDKSHGDFATNIAMMLGKPAGMPPRALAEKLLEALPESSDVRQVEIAGPGFINFFLNSAANNAVVAKVLEAGEKFGLSKIGQHQKVNVEFVSANPTGPLHVGHGRGAAYGQALSDLLAAAGYTVHREYYVNDAGRQMDILGTSVWVRYLQACNIQLPFPVNGYQGDYIQAIAADLVKQHGDAFKHSLETVQAELPRDENEGGDKELYIDALIAKAKHLLADDYETVFSAALNGILDDIRDDLSEFGLTYQEWFSERSLVTDKSIEKCIGILRDKNYLYEKEGALWFKSTDFGDEKDRVVQRENGLMTYFASDIAYHLNKYERGFDSIINIWGADHHGYIPRVKAALTALGLDENKLTILLVQFANLYRGKEKVPMSTRSGQFVTLRELRDEVGNDATRFFYAMRKSEQHMDFDLELAKSQSNDNPVYYVQYAHARVCRVFEKLSNEGHSFDQAQGLKNLDKLDTEHEAALIKLLGKYQNTIESAAKAYEPHQVIYYLRDLATAFHSYYNAHQFIIDEAELRDARFALIAAVKQVLANALNIVGVSAPEAM